MSRGIHAIKALPKIAAGHPHFSSDEGAKLAPSSHPINPSRHPGTDNRPDAAARTVRTAAPTSAERPWAGVEPGDALQDVLAGQAVGVLALRVADLDHERVGGLG